MATPSGHAGRLGRGHAALSELRAVKCPVALRIGSVRSVLCQFYVSSMAALWQRRISSMAALGQFYVSSMSVVMPRASPPSGVSAEC